MSTIKNILQDKPCLNMSVLPTPIQRLEKLSNKFKANIYCMRDDLTGFAFGGNKTRKLDFLIADALDKNYDTIIGIGANQSNFCRMATAAAKVHKLKTHLVLAGKKPEKPTGNLLISQLFGAIVHHVDTTDDNVLLEKAKELEEILTAQGKKVYNMPSGGSTPVGILGYIKAFDEIIDYSVKTGIEFSKIFVSSGSGGTQAGLVLGQKISGWEGQIIGISVGRKNIQLEAVLDRHISATVESFGLNPNFQGDIIVNDSYIGECYGAKTDDGHTAILEFANNEGILLDYVYSGKGAAGLLDYINKGKTNKDENILFIHTGGNIELFE